MKKILSILLMLALTMSLVGCGTKGSSGEGAQALKPIEVYANAQKNLQEVNSMEMNIKGSVNVTIGEESMDMTIDASVKELIHSETDVDLEMLMSMGLQGQPTMDMKAYFKDDVMYYDMLGMKYKTALPMEEAMSQTYSEMPEFDEALLSDSKIEDSESGKRITFDVKKENIKELLGDSVDNMLESMKMNDMGIEFTDFKFIMEVDENEMVKSYQMVYGAEYSYQGETMAMTFDMTCEVVSINEITEIAFPDDLDTYVDGLN